MWKTNILGSPTVMIFGEEDCRRLLKEEGNLVEVIWPDVTAELVCVQPIKSEILNIVLSTWSSLECSTFLLPELAMR